jgi:hypothetical protein
VHSQFDPKCTQGTPSGLCRLEMSGAAQQAPQSVQLRFQTLEGKMIEFVLESDCSLTLESDCSLTLESDCSLTLESDCSLTLESDCSLTLGRVSRRHHLPAK